MRTLFKMVFCLMTLTLLNPLYAATEIHWWHSMEGELGRTLEALVAKYNGTQSTFKVVPTYRGNYTENLNAAIAAYRAKKQPHLVQVFEVGTQTMMNSGAIYPVQDLLKDHKIAMEWDDFYLRRVYFTTVFFRLKNQKRSIKVGDSPSLS